MHLVVEKKGRPLWITTTGANGNERKQALILLDKLQLAQCKNNETLVACEADKGYDCDDTRQEILNRGYQSLDIEKIGKKEWKQEKFTNFSSLKNAGGLLRDAFPG